MPNSLNLWPGKPQSIVPLNRGHPFVGANCIFNYFPMSAPLLESGRNTQGTITGSPTFDSYGVGVASGTSYVTGSTNRPKFSGTTFTALAEVVLTTLDAGTVYHPFVGSTNDQFFELAVTRVAGNIGAQGSLYIAGSMRTIAPGYSLYTTSATDRILVGITFNQPAMTVYIGRALPNIDLVSATNSFGAPMGETGAAMLFGRNGANANPPTGSLKYCFVTDVCLNKSQVYSFFENPWQVFAPAVRRVFLGPAAGVADTLWAQACL